MHVFSRHAHDLFRVLAIRSARIRVVIIGIRVVITGIRAVIVGIRLVG